MDNKIKIHLLVNEIAGNGNAKKAFKKITSLLIKENIDFMALCQILLIKSHNLS